MTQPIQHVKSASDCAAKGLRGSPTVVFLPFSEELLNAAKRHTPCWERSEASPKNALVAANYPPSLGNRVNPGEGSFRADGANSQTAMALVPYSPQAMTVHVLRGEQWEAL
jgi:hypothetical protein